MEDVQLKILNMNEGLRKKLRESEISTEMGSIENCNFLAIIEINNRIVGASGLGGIFNVLSLQIHPDFFNRGLGPRLLVAVIEESKKRHYSFISASRNPENINAVRLHDFFKLERVFQIQYRKNFVREVILLEFNNRGKIMRKILQIFNNRIGISVLVISLKIFRKFLFKFFLTYPPEEFPDPDILYSIRNFKKI